MKKLLSLLILGSAILPALAAPPPYYVAGAWNGWSTHDIMTETGVGTGIYTRSFSGLTPGSLYEFKVTQGDWAWNYPGPNSWFYADTLGNVTISYDVNTYSDGWSATSQRIGSSYDPGSWTAAGDFQGWNNAAGNMTSLGGGIHYYQIATPGSYLWKPVVTGTWNSISWDNRSVGTSDWAFTVNSGEVANLYVDALRGVAKVEITAVPEPTTAALLGLGALLLFRRRS